ncbi:MAG: dipeptidase [Acutalibacteraceae bacterium]
MRFFDLHCDTLYKCVTVGGNINSNNYEVSFDKSKSFDKWVQCMAVWIPDDLRGERAFNLYSSAVDRLYTDVAVSVDKKIRKLDGTFDAVEDSPVNLMLTVEGSAALGGRIDRLKALQRDGVGMMTVTWNGECEAGGGADTDIGITDFGKRLISEMEQCNIVVDVSHASDKLFYDILRIAKRPIVASHSNSRTVCPHRRNLTDEQFKIIRDMGGIVGLNFHRFFLSENKSVTVDDILRHAEHFLELGGENTISIGSDFDGSDMPDDIVGVESIPYLYNEFIKKGYEKTLVDKIFYENAYNFFNTFDKSATL